MINAAGVSKIDVKDPNVAVFGFALSGDGGGESIGAVVLVTLSAPTVDTSLGDATYYPDQDTAGYQQVSSGTKIGKGAMTANGGVIASRLRAGGKYETLGDDLIAFTDYFRYGQQLKHEMHVYKSQTGEEVGIYAEGGFINKHGIKADSIKLSKNVMERLNGIDLDIMRATGRGAAAEELKSEGAFRDFIGGLLGRLGVIGMFLDAYSYAREQEILQEAYRQCPGENSCRRDLTI